MMDVLLIVLVGLAMLFFVLMLSEEVVDEDTGETRGDQWQERWERDHLKPMKRPRRRGQYSVTGWRRNA